MSPASSADLTGFFPTVPRNSRNFPFAQTSLSVSGLAISTATGIPLFSVSKLSGFSGLRTFIPATRR